MAHVSEVLVCGHRAPFAFRLQQNIKVEGHGKESKFSHSSQEARVGEERKEREEVPGTRHRLQRKIQ